MSQFQPVLFDVDQCYDGLFGSNGHSAKRILLQAG